MIAGQLCVHPGAAHNVHEVGRANLVHQADDGDVQRLAQGIRHRHLAAEMAVEILRRVVAKADGRIVDQRLRMGEAAIECHGIYYRLERRSWRAQRLCHIDEALTRASVIPGRSDRGEDISAAMIGQHDRD